MESRTPLAELSIGAISPEGWLRKQLELLADGLTGHLDEIWPDVGPASAWLGGSGEDWERGPYYLDGLAPLAYTLESERLIGKTRIWIEAILRSQQADGSFGPSSNPDWWPRMVALKALAQNLDRHHGMITGMFSGDEWLAGTAPEHGVELCAVVEFLYSLEQGFRWFEDPNLLDRAERVAYNMLAAHLSADCRSHQYHQQVNQIVCSIARRNWTYSSDDANTFALEPHFGCCTANLHQGWPKLVRALWYRDGSRLITGLHAPNRLRTTIEGISVQIQVQTDYPFGEKLVYRIEVGAPVQFELWLRIPGWCEYSWNYGLLPLTLGKPRRLSGPLSSPPFQTEWIGRTPVAPVMIEITGRLVSDWQVKDASAGSIPACARSKSPEQKLFLVPYGCTRIRIAEFPLLTS